MAEPLILPKGIVINTSWIYDEIAKQPVVSPEAIKKYWRVYTTTFQRLIDPTANRLENFWWHVWGSDRRHLPGPVLARLFEDISTGPTFVKLRGPPNRYEPPSQPPSPGLTPVQAPDIQAVPGASQKVLQPKVDQRAIAPSSTKKPPGKPILKKPRGPSASGPRPTARFVSPLGSDAEDVGSRDSEVASSTSTTTVTSAGGELKVPGNSSKESKKKTTTAAPPKKKAATFVASSRRRPAMPRRQSSQSTTGGSDTTSKDKSRGDSPGQAPEAEAKLSAKAAGKRPAAPAKPAEPSPPKPTTGASADTQDHQVVTQTPQITAQQPTHTKSRKGNEPVAKEGRREEAVAPPVAPKTAQKQSHTQGNVQPETTSSTVPPRPDTFSPRRSSSEMSRARRVIALTSSSTAQTSNATAQGTIIEFDENLPTRQIQEEDETLQPEPGRTGTASTSPLDPRFTPTLPSATPAVPLGRSKSQLTLLLERQSEKKPRR